MPSTAHAARPTLGPVAAALLAMLLAACTDPSAVPRAGTIVVTTRTTGALTPRTHAVSVNSGQGQALAANGVMVLAGLGVGGHRFALAGIPTECVVSGENPRTVPVTAGDTARTAFAVTCTPAATVTVAVTTAGLDVPTSTLAALVDSAARGTVGPNDSVAVPGVLPGTHALALGGVPADCTLAGASAQTVTATPGATLCVAFAVACRPVSLSNRLAFVSTRDGSAKLYAMNPDGAGQIRLTSDSVSEDAPLPSPDGRFVYYTAGGSTPMFGVITAAGSPVARIGNPGASIDYIGSWSPNGAYVSYTADADRLNVQVNVVRTSDRQTLTRLYSRSHVGSVFGEAWSPDGTQLLLHDNLGFPAYNYVRNVASRVATRLMPTDRSVSDCDPDWSPSGGRIAPIRQPCNTLGSSGQRGLALDVSTENPDGTGALNVINAPAGYSELKWSPDATEIAFRSTRGGRPDL